MILPFYFLFLALLQARLLLLSLPLPTTLIRLYTSWSLFKLISLALLPRLCLSLALYRLLCPLYIT
jgi:hypothetical protein